MLAHAVLTSGAPSRTFFAAEFVRPTDIDAGATGDANDGGSVTAIAETTSSFRR